MGDGADEVPQSADGLQQSVDALRNTAEACLKRVSKSENSDATFHNYGVATAIVLSTIGIALPSGDVCTYVSKGLIAIATAIFAIERSLDFGARWVFHRRLRCGYRGVLLQLNLVNAREGMEAKRAQLNKAVDSMNSLAEAESDIPGASIGDGKVKG